MMSAASVTAIYCILCKRLLGNRCRCRKDSYCEFVTVNMHMSLGVSLAVWIALLSTGICSEILKKTVLFVWTPLMCFHLFIYWFVVCCHLRQRGNVFTLLVCVSVCLFFCQQDYTESYGTILSEWADKVYGLQTTRFFGPIWFWAWIEDQFFHFSNTERWNV